MISSEMLSLREALGRNGISYCYSGSMTEDVLVGIGNAIRKHMELEEADSKTSKGVFSVFVEQMQNVIRYSSEKIVKPDESELAFGILAVGNLGGTIFVSCSNMVDADEVPRLEASLKKIQSLDKEGLKALYKDTLKGETPQGSKGAGVGFIEIARRAARGIEYDFTPIDDKTAFFTLKALF